MHTVALCIFCVFFLLVTIAGFWAARWRRPGPGLSSLEEWGLAGRSFGTLISWFLVGGDLYTAYTVIAVPAALYGAGSISFFAVPYGVFAYPYMMLVLPRFWRVCHRHGYITSADFVEGRYNHRPLAVAVALTGVLALMPYIALQLVGIRVVLAAVGLHGEWPLALAFLILALYTWTSGLRAPAVIAIIKDVMIYIMVFVLLVVLSKHLGGYGRIFELANTALAAHTPPASIHLRHGQFLPYVTLALGSAVALMLYPHTATAVLSASSANTVRRNAVLLPAYNLLLGLIALFGYAALAAGISARDPNTAVPLLLLHSLPEWFAGFCFAAIAIGALVPAAIMSIAASNLFTRNLLGTVLHRRPLNASQEATVARVVSFAVKLVALLFVLKLPATYAIEMQLLGGIWIGQIFPAVVCGLFTRWFSPWALLAGWAAGMISGTAMAASLGLRSSVYPVRLFGSVWPMYAAVPALLLNLAVSAGITVLLRLSRQQASSPARARDRTDPAVYFG